MCFSKTERKFLEVWNNNNYDFYQETVAKDLDVLNLHGEEYNEYARKKANYNRQLASRIKKKVRQMRNDIQLYDSVSEKCFSAFIHWR